MTPEMKAAMPKIHQLFRQLIASKVAIAVDLADGLAALPPEEWSGAIQAVAPMVLAEGGEPFTVAEALILASVGRRFRHLQDLAAVDLDDPATVEAYGSLSEVWTCIEARAQSRAQGVTR